MNKKLGRGSASISVAMPADLLDRLNALAEKSGQTRNSLMVEAITKAVAKADRDDDLMG